MNIFKHKSGLIEAKHSTVVKESVRVGNIIYRFDDKIKKLSSEDIVTGKVDEIEIPKSFTFTDFRNFIKPIQKLNNRII